MALNTSKCNLLTALPFKGLMNDLLILLCEHVSVTSLVAAVNLAQPRPSGSTLRRYVRV